MILRDVLIKFRRENRADISWSVEKRRFAFDAPFMGGLKCGNSNFTREGERYVIKHRSSLAAMLLGLLPLSAIAKRAYLSRPCQFLLVLLFVKARVFVSYLLHKFISEDSFKGVRLCASPRGERAHCE